MKKPRYLPPRCYLKHGAFFYVSPCGKWRNLGLDAQALAGHSSAGMTKRYIRDKLGVVVTPPSLKPIAQTRNKS